MIKEGHYEFKKERDLFDKYENHFFTLMLVIGMVAGIVELYVLKG